MRYHLTIQTQGKNNIQLLQTTYTSQKRAFNAAQKMADSFGHGIVIKVWCGKNNYSSFISN